MISNEPGRDFPLIISAKKLRVASESELDLESWTNNVQDMSPGIINQNEHVL